MCEANRRDATATEDPKRERRFKIQDVLVHLLYELAEWSIVYHRTAELLILYVSSICALSFKFDKEDG